MLWIPFWRSTFAEPRLCRYRYRCESISLLHVIVDISFFVVQLRERKRQLVLFVGIPLHITYSLPSTCETNLGGGEPLPLTHTHTDGRRQKQFITNHTANEMTQPNHDGPAVGGGTFHAVDPASASFQTRAYVQQALRSVTHDALEHKVVKEVQADLAAADQELKSLIRDNLGTFMDSRDAMRAILAADKQLFSGEALHAIVAVFDNGRSQCEELVEPIMKVHQQLQLARQVRDLLGKFQSITAVPSILYRACGVRVAVPCPPSDFEPSRTHPAALASVSAAPSPSPNREAETEASARGVSGCPGRDSVPLHNAVDDENIFGGDAKPAKSRASAHSAVPNVGAAPGGGQHFHLEAGEELVWWFGTPLVRLADPEERHRRMTDAVQAGGRANASRPPQSPAAAGGSSATGHAALDVAVLHFRRALLFLEEHYDVEKGVWRGSAAEQEADELEMDENEKSTSQLHLQQPMASAATLAGGAAMEPPGAAAGPGRTAKTSAAAQRRRQKAASERTHRVFLLHYTGALLRAALFLVDHLGSDQLLRCARPSDTVLIEDLLHMMMELSIGTVKLKGFARALAVKLGAMAGGGGGAGGGAALQHLRSKLMPTPAPAPASPGAGGPDAGAGGSFFYAQTPPVLYELQRAGAAIASPASAGHPSAGAARSAAAVSGGGGFTAAGSTAAATTAAATAGGAPSLYEWDWMQRLGGTAASRSPTGSVIANGGADDITRRPGLWHPVQYFMEVTQVHLHRMVEERAQALCRHAAEILERRGTTTAASEITAQQQLLLLQRQERQQKKRLRRERAAAAPAAAEGTDGKKAVARPTRDAKEQEGEQAPAPPQSFFLPGSLLPPADEGEQSQLDAGSDESDGDDDDDDDASDELTAVDLRRRKAAAEAETAALRTARAIAAAFEPRLGAAAGTGVMDGPTMRRDALQAVIPVAQPPDVAASSGPRFLDVTPVLLASCVQVEEHVERLLEKLRDRSETEDSVLAAPLHTDAAELLAAIAGSLEYTVTHYWGGLAQSIHSGQFDFAAPPESAIGRMLQQEILLAAATPAEPSGIRLSAHDAAGGFDAHSTAAPSAWGIAAAPSVSMGEYCRPEMANTTAPSHGVGSLEGGGGDGLDAAEGGGGGRGPRAAPLLPSLHFVPLLVRGRTDVRGMADMRRRLEDEGGRSGEGGLKAAGKSRSGQLEEEEEEDEDEPITLQGYSMLRLRGMIRQTALVLRDVLGAFIHQCMSRVFMGMMQSFTVADLSANDTDERVELCAAALVEVLLGQWEASFAGVADAVRRIKVTIGESFSAAVAATRDDDEDEAEEQRGEDAGPRRGHRGSTDGAGGRGKAAEEAARADERQRRRAAALMDVSTLLTELEALRSANLKVYLRGVGELLNAYMTLLPIIRRVGDTTLERRVRARLDRDHLSSNACNKLLNTLAVLLDRTVPFLHRHAEVFRSATLFSSSLGPNNNNTNRSSSSSGRQRKAAGGRPGAGGAKRNRHKSAPPPPDSSDPHAPGTPCSAPDDATAKMAEFHSLLVAEHVRRHGRYVSQLCGDLLLVFVDTIHLKSQLVGAMNGQHTSTWNSSSAQLTTAARQREVMECMADVLCVTSTVAPLFLEHQLSPCLLALLVTLDPDTPIADRPAALRRAEIDFEEDQLARVAEHAQLVLNAILEMHLVVPAQRITHLVFRDGVARPDLDWQRVSRHTTSAVRPYLAEAIVTMAEANEALHWVQQPLLASVVTQKLLLHLSRCMVSGLTLNSNYVELLTVQSSRDFIEHGTLLWEAEVLTVCQLLESVVVACTASKNLLPELPEALRALRAFLQALQDYQAQRQHKVLLRTEEGASAGSLSTNKWGSGGGGGRGEAGDDSSRLEQQADAEHHQRQRIERRNEMVRVAVSQLRYILLDVCLAPPWQPPSAAGPRHAAMASPTAAAGGPPSFEPPHPTAEDAASALPSAVTESIAQRLAKRLERDRQRVEAGIPRDGTTAGGRRGSLAAAAPPPETAAPAAPPVQESTAPVAGRRGVARVLLPEVVEAEPPAAVGESLLSRRATSAATLPSTPGPAPPAEEEDGGEEDEDAALDDATRLYLQVVRKGRQLLQTGPGQPPERAKGSSRAAPPATGATPEPATTATLSRRRSAVAESHTVPPSGSPPPSAAAAAAAAAAAPTRRRQGLWGRNSKGVVYGAGRGVTRHSSSLSEERKQQSFVQKYWGKLATLYASPALSGMERCPASNVPSSLSFSFSSHAVILVLVSGDGPTESIRIDFFQLPPHTHTHTLPSSVVIKR
eukprot:gene281-154_t